MKITVHQLKQLIKEQVEEMSRGTRPVFVQRTYAEEGPVDEHQHEPGDGSWWVNDAQGIPLCRVCDECEKQKLSQYRPEILSGYDQNDVDEPIDPNY